MTEAIGKIIGLTVIILLIAMLFTLPVMWLWNDTMPKLFHLPEIGFWMALKISLLCSLLFKSSTSSSKS